MIGRVTALSACVCVSLLTLATTLRPAAAQNMDLSITDDTAYARAVAAISAAEHTRYDYANNPRPRVACVVAGMLEFATRNPLADEHSIAAFVKSYNAALMSAAPGDPDLQRNSNLLPALRFTQPPAGATPLRGMDTNVGGAATELLGIVVPNAFDFNSLQTRTIGFESGRRRSFANSAEFYRLLVVGFLGRDLDGADNQAVASVLRELLENEGYEPFPDGIDDGRFKHVAAGLSHLPANYAAYLLAISVPPGQAVPPAWGQITQQFDAISASADAQLAELIADEPGAPTIREGVDRARDPAILDELAQDLRARRDLIAMPRTILSANALLLFQNQNPAIRDLAMQTEIASGLVLESFDVIGLVVGGAKVVGGVATAIFGFASAPATAGMGIVGIVVGVALIVEGGATLVDAWGEQEPSAAEAQIFEQVIAVRQDIEAMRNQMHDRFDRIEVQLNFVFEGMAAGFNALGDQIGDLQDSVENIVRDVLINRAALERIEDALYGMAENLLQASLADSTNTYLHYRGFNGVDLPYAGAQSFLDGANRFFTFTVDTAQNTTLAGPLVSTLSVATAEETLTGASIGRNVNDLRVFPFHHLGLPRLGTNRVVAPAQWAQGAAAYAQFARENPWYFAYQHEQQILSGVPVADRKIERIVREGEKLASAMAAGRSQALFDALFDGYDGATEDFRTAVDIEVLAPKALFDGVTSVDPWGPTEQNVRDLAPQMTQITHTGGGFPLILPVSSTGFWGLFRSDAPQTAAILARAIPPGNQPWGEIRWRLSGESSGDTVRFLYITHDGLTAFERSVRFNIGMSNSAFALLWDCPTAGLREALLSSSSIVGKAFTACGGSSTHTVITDSIVSGVTSWTERAKSTPPDMTQPTPGFSGQVSIDGDSFVIGVPFAAGGGAAYVYTITGPRTWTLEGEIRPLDLGPQDRFGWSVSIRGDRIIIGAPKQAGRGAAYVYVRSNGAWVREHRLLAADSASGGDFGYAVSLSDDEAVVGAPFRDEPGAVDAGATYIFRREDGAWVQDQKLLRPVGDQAGARFGSSVSVRDDGLIVGAPNEDFGPVMNRGAAYVFARQKGAWTSQGAALVASDGAANHSFGWSVAIDNGRAMVGAPSANDRGAVYSFTLAPQSGVWSQAAKITATDANFGNRFGDSVALDGPWALTGAQSSSGPAGNFQGAAYLFASDAAGAVPPTYASDAAASQRLGSAVALSGNVAIVGGLAGANPDQGIQGRATAYALTIGSNLDPFIDRRLRLLQKEALQTIVDRLSASSGSNLLRDTANALSDWKSLIEAYATFSLPFAMELSSALRAGLGGDPATGELSLAAGALRAAAQALLSGAIEPASIYEVMRERAAIAQTEVNGALKAQHQAHPYFNWMLAEMRSLRNQVFDLAANDTYEVAMNTTLNVEAGAGLTRNDVRQLCRIIEVDTFFTTSAAYVAPQHGHVVVRPDGGFTYTPDPGFRGKDRFTYRIGTSVAGVGCQPGQASRGLLDQRVFSSPAEVVILVRGPACAADITGDGLVDSNDLAQLLGQWNCASPPSACPADVSGDGRVNSADLSVMLGSWGPCR